MKQVYFVSPKRALLVIGLLLIALLVLPATAYADEVDIMLTSEPAIGEGSAPSEEDVSIMSGGVLTYDLSGTTHQTEARKMLAQVNATRASAGNGASPLVWNANLEKAAQQRAAEIVTLFEHTRPDGNSWTTAVPAGTLVSNWGENILAGGVTTAADANISWNNSPGHYANRINPAFVSTGCAYFSFTTATNITINGWVELFSGVAGTTPPAAVDGSATYTINASAAKLSLTMTGPTSLSAGSTGIYKLTNTNPGVFYIKHDIPNTSFDWASSNPGVASVNTGGVATGLAAGTTSVTASFGSSAGESFSTNLTVTQASLSDPQTSITGIDSSYVYTGAPVEPLPVVKYGSTTLVKDTDYTVSYASNINVGTATVTIAGMGSYGGSVSKTFDVTAASIAGATVSGIDASYAYTGAAIAPVPTVKIGSTTLIEGTHYTVTYSGNIDVGNATITIAGMGNYGGTTTKTFAITALSLSGATISGVNTSYVYTGAAIAPDPTVKVGGITLTKDTHYTVAYSSNVDVGTAAITISGIGNYSGTVAETFAITAASLSGATITGVNASYVYTGAAIAPVPTVKVGSTTLTKDTHYTVTYSGNIDVGTVTVTIAGIGGYTGTVIKPFDITAAPIAGATITGVSTSYTYSGTAITPVPTVKVGSITLIKDTHYTVTYSDNIEVGNATITITGKDNYAGTITETFKISALSLSGATISGVSASYVYTGKAIAPTPVVRIASTTLVKGTHYTVAYSSNTNVGTATITITGKGNYCGTVTQAFAIAKTPISSAVISGVDASYTYTGKAITPVPTLKYGGTTLTRNTHYTVAYKNNTNVGIVTVTITGKGNFSGTTTTTFFIAAKAISGSTINGVNASYSYTGAAIAPVPIVKAGNTTLVKGTHYTVKYSNNVKIGTATITITGKGNYKGTITKTFKITALALEYSAHVEGKGWMPGSGNGSVAGVTGSSKRIEALKLTVPQVLGISGGIKYSAHVQNEGWQPAVKVAAGQTGLVGTEGKALRLEAFTIELTGDMTRIYDVYYRVHAQEVGWMAWAKNGQIAGTAGLSLRLEAIQIYVVPKGGIAPGNTFNNVTTKTGTPRYVNAREIAGDVNYGATVHIQGIGNKSYNKINGSSYIGTSGQAKRVEAITLALINPPSSGGLKYRTHIEGIGWQGWKTDNKMSGTSGQARRLEAISINLTGNLAKTHDVYYRTHVQGIGWTGWAKNGQDCGSAGYSYRMEAMQIVIAEKGGMAPGLNSDYFYKK